MILGQASLMQQLASTHQTQAAQLLDSARHLASVQAQLQHTEDGIAALRAQLAGRKTALGKLLSGRQALLDSLTAAQEGTLAIAAGLGAASSSCSYAAAQVLAVVDGLVERPCHVVVDEGVDAGLAVPGALGQVAAGGVGGIPQRVLPAASEDIAAAVRVVHAMPTAE